MKLQEARNMALGLMNYHGLTEWIFQFDNSKNRFGLCHASKKIISLSRPLVELNSYHHVRDTILHEIAHALVPIKHHHDWVWRRKAIEIGCNGSRAYGSDVVQPKMKYTATCPVCSRELQRTVKRTGLACGACCRGKYSRNYLLIWSLN